MSKMIRSIFCDEAGAELPEYALAGALITLAIITAYTALRTDIVAALDRIGSVIN